MLFTAAASDYEAPSNALCAENPQSGREQQWILWGNLAQYVTLFAMDTLIDRCLDFDGQGFSEELCSTQRYEEALERNGDKLFMIASELDIVNVLFNPAVPEEHRMYIDGNPEDNIFHYHKNVVPSQKLLSLAWHFLI